MQAFEQQKTSLYRLASILAKYRELDGIVYYDTDQHLPAAAVERRGELCGFLASQRQQVILSNEMKELLDYFSDAEACARLTRAEQGMVRHFARDRRYYDALPLELTAEIAAANAASQAKWKECKYNENFTEFAPYLARTIDLTRQMIDCWGYEGHPLNALLQFSEPGVDVAMLDTVFTQIRDRVVPLVQAIHERGASIDDSFLHERYDIARQRTFCTDLLRRMGFDFNRGLEGDTEHPYTNGVNLLDVRVTNHFYEDNLASAILTELHEGGHGLYEQYADPSLLDTPFGCGMDGGLHEGSSTLWENSIGQSRAFWKANFPLLQKLFPSQLGAVDAEGFYRAINKLNGSLIRIHADEATYNLHVLLRYEMEKELFSGNLQVADLPEVWNQKTEAYLGRRPQSLAEGVLQDVHWAGGMYGYFQSYTLGKAYHAQIMDAMRKQLDVDSLLEQNRLTDILDWLKEHWYRYGCTTDPKTLLTEITGRPVDANCLCDHLERKYTDLYQL